MPQKILLVDDERGIRKVLKISLEDSGYEVITAKNGEEALELYRKEQPPIVLTDIKMPGMDGIQLLKIIKKENPDTEIIMITGHGDMELAIQSLKFDAVDFITKPINDEVLEIAIKRANEKIDFKSKIKEYTENLEQLVEEKTGKLIEAEHLATVGQTVAGLAHGIKNISGGLRGGTFVLEKGIELDNKKYLTQGWDMVKGNVGRLKDMALDLLNYTKSREPEYSLCHPNKPANEVYDLMVSYASEQDVTLELDLDEDLKDFYFDEEGVHRVLLNLVTNAIDACTNLPSSNRDLKVLIRSLKVRDWGVEYQVIDNGCGIDEETKEKIFKRFFTTKGSKGTGLGLMIAKKIIDEGGGEIDLDSEEGKGSKFVIKLPEKSNISESEAI